MQNNNESKGQHLLNELRSVLPEKLRKTKPEELNRELLNDPLFMNLMKMSPSAIVIFSYESLTYEYFSPNIEDIMGYPLEKMQGISGAEFALNTFHPDHLSIVMRAVDVMKKYYFDYAQLKRAMDVRMTMTVQLKRGDGKFIWTMQQTNVLEVTNEGFPLRTLIFLSDITGIKGNNKVDFVMSAKNQNESGYETLHVSHHEPGVEYRLTEREIEILNCVSKGLRNHEIADKLNISTHTVITHRRNIMKKSGKENIIQLLVD